MERDRLLVIAATDRELAGSDGWRTLRCGVGPVEAAVATATCIAQYRPAAILHIGIAGARRRCALSPGTIVIGSESIYCDMAPRNPFSPRLLTTSATLITTLQRAVPGALVCPIGTSAVVGGTRECDIEAIEGFAVLRAAELAFVPAIEVRAISNDIEEADRARWHFDDAFAAISAATPRLVAEMLACVN
jgi:nucleoside phosphorylase